MTKPRICEILGVEVGQRLNYGDIANDICFNENGEAIFPDYPETMVPADVVLSMINNPDGIRNAMFTEKDIADAKAVASVFQNSECIIITRELMLERLLISWKNSPFFDYGLNPEMFPSLIPGESIMISNSGKKVDLYEGEK